MQTGKRKFRSVRKKYIITLALSSILITLVLNIVSQFLSGKRSDQDLLRQEQRNMQLIAQSVAAGRVDRHFIARFTNRENIRIILVQKDSDRPLILGEDDLGTVPGLTYRLSADFKSFEKISGTDIYVPRFQESGEQDEQGLFIRLIYEDDKNQLIYDFKNGYYLSEYAESFQIHQNLVTILALVFYLALSLFLFGKFLSPTAKITRNIRTIRDQGIQEKLDVIETGDEFEELSRVFNEMIHKISNQMEEQQRFIDDASHELKTPLTILEGYISLLERKRNDPEFIDEYIDVVKTENSRMKNLILSLLELSAETRPESGKADADAVYKRITEKYRKLNPDFEISLNSTPGIFLNIPERELESLLFILLDNAIKYSGSVKKITVISKPDSLTVRDSGNGIPSDDLDKIFDRFYRVNKDRSRDSGGNGLGLSILKKVCGRNGIKVSVNSELGKFTEFVLTFLNNAV